MWREQQHAHTCLHKIIIPKARTKTDSEQNKYDEFESCKNKPKKRHIRRTEWPNVYYLAAKANSTQT